MTIRKPSLFARDAFREAVEWFPRGNCHGMQSAFTEASHEEQVAVCRGTAAPWMKTCPVLMECREDILVRYEIFGMAEINDGNLVAGALTPGEQRKMIRRKNPKK